MKPILFFLTVISVCYGCNAKNEASSAKEETPASKSEAPAADNRIPSAAIQIKLALLAAPKEKRDSCTVYGYSADTQFVLLQKGSNELICVADDPRESGLSVSSYMKELEPFMQRGRELRKQGIQGQQVFDEREKEVKAGTLQMPKQPATLYVYNAKNFDAETGDVKDGYLRYVIYIPYATAASTGLPEKPDADGMPWIMHPGTHGAHIMINP